MDSILTVRSAVLEDFIPETNDHLTLIQDDVVYVFKKEVPVRGPRL